MDDDEEIDVRHRLPRYTKNFSDGFSSTQVSTLKDNRSDGNRPLHLDSNFATTSEFRMTLRGDQLLHPPNPFMDDNEKFVSDFTEVR